MQKASGESRKHSTQYRADQNLNLKNIIRKYSETALKEKHFDFLISGHVHFREDFVLGNGRSRLINLGTWLNEPGAFQLEDQGSTWREL